MAVILQAIPPKGRWAVLVLCSSGAGYWSRDRKWCEFKAALVSFLWGSFLLAACGFLLLLFLGWPLSLRPYHIRIMRERNTQCRYLAIEGLGL